MKDKLRRITTEYLELLSELLEGGLEAYKGVEIGNHMTEVVGRLTKAIEEVEGE